MPPLLLPLLASSFECVQVCTVFASLTKVLGEAAVPVPEGTAKELLPDFTDSGWEFKTELFLEAR